MAKFLDTTTRRQSTPASFNLLRRLMGLVRRRRPSGIWHLSDAMLRDIGLSDRTRSELRKIERFRRP